MESKVVRTYYKDGQIESEYHYQDSWWHRKDGPAYVWYYKNGQVKYESYYINDQSHREDGPAKIWYKKNREIEYEEYWIKGELITDDFQIMVMDGLGMKKGDDETNGNT